MVLDKSFNGSYFDCWVDSDSKIWSLELYKEANRSILPIQSLNGYLERVMASQPRFKYFTESI